VDLTHLLGELKEPPIESPKHSHEAVGVPDLIPPGLDQPTVSS
jgi:hypothetical protein